MIALSSVCSDTPYASVELIVTRARSPAPPYPSQSSSPIPSCGSPPAAVENQNSPLTCTFSGAGAYASWSLSSGSAAFAHSVAEAVCSARGVV